MANPSPPRASRIWASLLGWLISPLASSTPTTTVTAAPVPRDTADEDEDNQAADPTAPTARARGPPEMRRSRSVAVTRRRPEPTPTTSAERRPPTPVRRPRRVTAANPTRHAERNHEYVPRPPTTATLTPSSGREFR